jgi:hypothetical protein
MLIEKLKLYHYPATRSARDHCTRPPPSERDGDSSCRQMGESDFNARTGVLRLELYGNDKGDDGNADFTEDHFPMDIINDEPLLARSDAAHKDLARAGATGFAQHARVEKLDIETVNSNPVLPTGRKWAIRFNAGGTVTIMLGMRDYGRGWFSAYFADLIAARLGIPFRRVRVYYSAKLPAVLQTPVPSPVLFRWGDIGPAARAAADVIERMCDQVIVKGRLRFAAMANACADDVGFDQPTGRFFVLDRERSGNILELADAAPGGSFGSTELAKKLRRAGRPSIDLPPDEAGFSSPRLGQVQSGADSNTKSLRG